MNKQNTRRGFTLIELLVVVLIIGILAAVALPQYQQAVMKSRFSTMKMLVKSVTENAEAYYLEHGNYPTDFNELVIGIPQPSQIHSSSSHTEADYNWGTCYMEFSVGGGNLFSCADNTIGYGQRFKFSPILPKIRNCQAKNNNSIAIRICQQETGKVNPEYDTDSAKSWRYTN